MRNSRASPAEGTKMTAKGRATCCRRRGSPTCRPRRGTPALHRASGVVGGEGACSVSRPGQFGQPSTRSSLNSALAKLLAYVLSASRDAQQRDLLGSSVSRNTPFDHAGPQNKQPWSPRPLSHARAAATLCNGRFLSSCECGCSLAGSLSLLFVS